MGIAVLSGMQIEVTNQCNYRCVMCPFHGKSIPETRRAIGFMTLDRFDDALTQFRNLGGEFVIPQGAGESFLHPDILHMVDLIKRKHRLKAGLNTNGSVLDETLMKGLLKVGIDEFGFSIDANSRETFRKITGADDLDTLEEKVRTFVAMRNSLKLKKPLIRVLLVDQSENTNEVSDFISKWSGIVDETIIQAERTGLGRTLKHGRSEPRRACAHLFDTIFVEWNGNVVVCCEDWASHTVQGNIFEDSMGTIWYSRSMRQFRKWQRKNDFSQPEICLNCEAWAGGNMTTRNEENLIVQETELTRIYRKNRIVK